MPNNTTLIYKDIVIAICEIAIFTFETINRSKISGVLWPRNLEFQTGARVSRNDVILAIAAGKAPHTKHTIWRTLHQIWTRRRFCDASWRELWSRTGSSPNQKMAKVLLSRQKNRRMMNWMHRALLDTAVQLRNGEFRDPVRTHDRDSVPNCQIGCDSTFHVSSMWLVSS